MRYFTKRWTKRSVIVGAVTVAGCTNPMSSDPRIFLPVEQTRASYSENGGGTSPPDSTSQNARGVFIGGGL